MYRQAATKKCGTFWFSRNYDEGCLKCVRGRTMKILKTDVAFAFCVEVILSPAATAAVDIGDAVRSAPSSGRSLLAADCTQTASVSSPLPPRPRVSRSTAGSKRPHRARHRPRRHRPVRHAQVHKAVVHKKVHHVGKHVVKKRPAHRRPVVAHRPSGRGPVAGPRRTVRRVTYASPLCFDRAPMIESLLSPFDVPYAPLGEQAAVAIQNVLSPPDSPVGPVGSTPSGGGVVPFTPLFTPPFITPPITPPGNGGNVTPPPPTPGPGVPEVSTWAMMFAGFSGIGFMMRRRRRRKSADA